MAEEKIKVYRIAAVLAEKGIDNKTLAKLMGVTPETVSRWCNNEIQPKPENLWEIAQLTHTNLQELMIKTSYPEGVLSKAEEVQELYNREQKEKRKRRKKSE